MRRGCRGSGRTGLESRLLTEAKTKIFSCFLFEYGAEVAEFFAVISLVHLCTEIEIKVEQGFSDSLSVDQMFNALADLMV